MMRKTHTRLAMLGLTTALTGFAAQGASAAQVFATDLIVQGSTCTGFDCTSSESFGSDTLRLKENNLRIHFQDTSSSSSFPTRDWRIVANDSTNGGSEYLAIEDADAGNQPFRVDAGAGANALRINSSGNIGIGTASPVVELHVADGDSPTLRLEQNGSAGFTAQTFDIAANETNFFVRDVTNGSELPFKIKPGADDNALFVAANNNIGFGTDAPNAPLHIRVGGTNQDAPNAGDDVIVQDSGPVRIAMINTAQTNNQIWTITNNDSLRLSAGTSAPEFLLTPAGNLTITGSLITTGGGGACTVADPCDAVFDPEVYTVPSIEEHAEKMWADKHLPAVGPTGPSLAINVNEKMLRMLNELEHAHIYIEQLNDRIKVLEAEIEKG